MNIETGFPPLVPDIEGGSTVSRGAATSKGEPLGGTAAVGSTAVQQEAPRGNQGTGLPHPKGGYPDGMKGWNDVHGTEVS